MYTIALEERLFFLFLFFFLPWTLFHLLYYLFCLFSPFLWETRIDVSLNPSTIKHHWISWLPCLYMVKTLKSLLLQNQENFKAESRYMYIASETRGYSIWDSRSTKFVQMMILGWPLTFLWLCQICIPILLYLENVEESFSENVLKTHGWYLQHMIEVVKHFSYNQFMPGSYTPFGCICLKSCNL